MDISLKAKMQQVMNAVTITTEDKPKMQDRRKTFEKQMAQTEAIEMEQNYIIKEL